MTIYRTLLLFVIMMPAHHASAQDISIVTHENKLAIAITAESETDKYDSIQLIMDKKGAGVFYKKLVKSLRKFGVWSNVASENNIAGFEKSLKKQIPIQGVYFENEGNGYCSGKRYLFPIFTVESDGIPYLKIREEEKGAIGTDILAVTTGTSIGYKTFSSINTFTQVRKLVDFFYSIRIAKSDIPDWLNKFLMAKRELEMKEQEMKEIKKRNNKLFK
jgi:hypothetical protein